MNLFMQKLAELENQYNTDKQALREARLEIHKVEAFTKKHGGAAVVCVYDGVVSTWVGAYKELAEKAAAHDARSDFKVGDKYCYELEGVKVLEW